MMDIARAVVAAVIFLNMGTNLLSAARSIEAMRIAAGLGAATGPAAQNYKRESYAWLYAAAWGRGAYRLDGGSLRRPARGGYLRRRVSWSRLGMAVGWSLYNRVAPNGNGSASVVSRLLAWGKAVGTRAILLMCRRGILKEHGGGWVGLRCLILGGQEVPVGFGGSGLGGMGGIGTVGGWGGPGNRSGPAVSGFMFCGKDRAGLFGGLDVVILMDFQVDG